jgi:hypothetical protein
MSNPDVAALIDRLADPAAPLPRDLYALPYWPGPHALGIVPMSGGADSTATALVMRRLFPTLPLRFCFWDTGAEPQATHDALAAVEAWLGIAIERFRPEAGLFELIARWNGFFPSNTARYCTRELKIRPFERWIETQIGAFGQAHAFVGLRADEERIGLVSRHDRVHQHAPLRSLGFDKSAVFRLLAGTVGIPAIYRWGRTRSGCTVCPFQSSRELLGTLRRTPEAFAAGEAVEAPKLSAADRRRWQTDAVPLARETRLGPNHLTLPIPPRADLRTRATAAAPAWPPQRRRADPRAVGDLFGPVNEVFALGELFIHPGVGDHGVWWQAPVAWSPTLAGLRRQAAQHRRHRLATAEAMGLSPASMADELVLAVYRLALPASVDIGPPSAGSYTWKPGLAYRQLRHVYGWVERTLHAAGLAQARREVAQAPPGTRAAEERDACSEALARIEGPVGELLAMDRLDYPEAEAHDWANELEIVEARVDDLIAKYFPESF